MVETAYSPDGTVASHTDQRKLKVALTYDIYGRLTQEDTTHTGDQSVSGTTQRTISKAAAKASTSVLFRRSKARRGL